MKRFLFRNCDTEIGYFVLGGGVKLETLLDLFQARELRIIYERSIIKINELQEQVLYYVQVLIPESRPCMRDPSVIILNEERYEEQLLRLGQHLAWLNSRAAEYEAKREALETQWQRGAELVRALERKREQLREYRIYLEELQRDVGVVLREWQEAVDKAGGQSLE